MSASLAENSELQRVVESIRRGGFTESDADRLMATGSEAVKFVLLALAVAAISPHAPSIAAPPYEKPPPKKKSKPRGGKPGHEGKRRKKPDRFDQKKTYQAPCCLDCGGKLKRTGDTRKRYTEDIPEDLKPVATEHTIHSD